MRTLSLILLILASASAPAAEPPSYRHDVLPVLGKLGCSTAACHGSPSGKGGFKLSLWGFDPAADHEALSLRSDESTPAESLILEKPTLKTKHGGGLRFKPEDAAYQTLLAWVKAGCQNDAEKVSPVSSITVTSSSAGNVIHLPADAVHLTVKAKHVDGVERDITHLAAYSSTTESVARAELGGAIFGLDRGETSIIVRYLQHIQVVPFTFTKEIPGFVWNDPPAANYVDDLVHAKLRQLSYLPAELCSDEEFIRRVHLDVLGLLPDVDAVQHFLADKTADKRARLIDELLQRPEHARFWAQRWADLLQLTVARLGKPQALAFYAHLEKAWSENTPYDDFARQLVTAGGDARTEPAANFYRLGDDSFELMEAASVVLIGTQIQCAKCHNHPIERWTQSDYYGLSHFFQRIERKRDDKNKEEVVVSLGEPREILHPGTKAVVEPWLPGVAKTQLADNDDPRELLARWLTAPENPLFARAEANRLWAWLLGKGLVDPVDDLRDTNPPANRELLDALTNDFIAHKFDRRYLLRTILNSHTYQRSAQASAHNRDDTRYFSRFYPRKLTAEQTLDAVSHVTGVYERLAGVDNARATQLAAPDLVDHEFLKQFGQPMRAQACACERSPEVSLGAALAMYNGRTLMEKLQNDRSRLRQALAAGKSNDELIDELYLAAFARAPRLAEKAVAAKHLAAHTNRQQALEDLCWAILNTNEFLFQH